MPIELFCIEDFTFNVYIGACEKLSDDEKIKPGNTLNYVFSEQGIGAKTALGMVKDNLECIRIASDVRLTPEFIQREHMKMAQ